MVRRSGITTKNESGAAAFLARIGGQSLGSGLGLGFGVGLIYCKSGWIDASTLIPPRTAS